MLITNFASGELSEKLYGRADIQQYYQGCSVLKNFNIVPTGGIDRRPGFKRCGKMTGPARLIPFIYNKDLSYVFEFGYDTREIDGNTETYGYVDLWINGKKLNPVDIHYFYNGQSFGEVIVDWLPNNLNAIREIQYVQNFDTIVFVQRDVPPFSITFNGSTIFTMQKLSFDFEPDIDVVDDYGIYDPQQDKDLPGPDTTTFQTPNNYPGVVAFFNNRLWLGSTRNKPQKVWASAVPDTKGPRYTTFDNYTHYVTVNRLIKDPDLHLFTGTLTNGSNVITGVTQDFTGIENITDYYITADGVPIGTKVISVTANTIIMSENATKYATSIAMSIQLWKYADEATADDYEYDTKHTDMTTADNGFYFELASDQNDNIKWLCSSQHMIIGTESSEYVVPSGVTALNASVSLNGRHSSDDVQAIFVDTAAIFFAQGKRAIREFYYNSQTQAFLSNNITMANPEILAESEAVDFDYINNPYGRLIITKQDGTMAVLLYEKSAGVLGWSRIEHGTGKIISCATVRSDNSSDTMYVAVRYGDGSVYMEELNLESDIFLDGWSLFTEESEEEYTNDAVIFDGEKVVKLADCPNKSELYGENVYIGYEYESVMRSMPVINNNVTGNKRITDLEIRFSNSCLPEIVNPNGVTEYITGLAEPYSGIRKVVYPGASSTDVFFTIKTKKPYNLTVLAVNANLA